MDQNPPDRGAEFFPRGALAFFALMASCFAVAWLILYAMLLRQR
ncbi:MAG: hypothetical protein ACHQ2Z_06985 [Elusimicrobiota bacterium]